MTSTSGIARKITAAFSRGDFRVKKPGAPETIGWSAMPEVYQTELLRTRGASDIAIRHFLTFTAAMDRSRDADTLWKASATLFR